MYKPVTCHWCTCILFSHLSYSFIFIQELLVIGMQGKLYFMKYNSSPSITCRRVKSFGSHQDPKGPNGPNSNSAHNRLVLLISHHWFLGEGGGQNPLLSLLPVSVGHKASKLHQKLLRNYFSIFRRPFLRQCGQIQKIGWQSKPNRENLYIL